MANNYPLGVSPDDFNTGPAELVDCHNCSGSGESDNGIECKTCRGSGFLEVLSDD